MTEMDFDELDRAVNSLMGGVKRPTDSSDQTTTLAITTTLAKDEKPEYDKLEQAAQKIGNDTISGGQPSDMPENVVDVTSSSKKGRFMDVMHPSSDMTSPSSPQPVHLNASIPARPVSELHAGIDITPQSDSDASVVSTADDIEPHSDSNESTVLQENDEGTAAVATDIPDSNEATVETEPRDEVEITTPMADATIEQVSTEQTDDTAKADQDANVPAVIVQPNVAAAEPQTSPFIADAKVEKRPLGGAVLDAPTTSGSEDANASVSTPELELPAQPAAVAHDQTIPDEYHDQLMAIETGSVIADPSSTEQGAPVTTTAPAATAPTVENAIYDVDNYHKPLSHPAKKSSGWLWVILTIIIVAICGGAGAAYYLLST